MSDTYSRGKHARHLRSGDDTVSQPTNYPSRDGRASNPKRTSVLSSTPAFAPNGRRTGADVNMGGSGSHHHGGYHRRRRRIVLAIIATLLVLVAVFGAGAFLFYRSAMSVKTQASAIVSQTSTLQEQVLSKDVTGAQSTVASMASEASSMQEETSGLLWKVASMLPVYGSDVTKVRALATVANDLSENALVPLASQLSGMSLSSIVGTDGTIDVTSLSNLVSVLTEVAPVVERSATTVDGLGSAKLTQIDTPLQKAKAQLNQLSSAVSGAADLAPLLPTLLGANGQTKTYLIVAQNNAEIRSTGGFPGSCGTLSVTDGKLSLGEFESIAWENGLDSLASSCPVTAEETSLFGKPITDVASSVNMMPDFTRAATIWRWMWQQQTGTAVDGVVAVDPVFLQQVLGLVGGVTMSDGSTLDGSNAAEVLLHEVYVDKTPVAQDAYFGEAAKKAFNKLTSSIGTVSLSSLASTVQTAVKNRRLHIWLSDADQQETISSLDCSGALSSDETSPELGVYVSDETWSKIDWYLDLSTQTGTGTLNADGTTSYQVTTTVNNTLTDSELATLPAYIYGYDPLKRSHGDMITRVYLLAPAGGSISDVQVSGYMSIPFSTGSYEGLQILSGMTQDEPGETTTITYTVTTSSAATSSLTVESTPLATTS